jgi:hypothetical protein
MFGEAGSTIIASHDRELGKGVGEFRWRTFPGVHFFLYLRRDFIYYFR